MTKPDEGFYEKSAREMVDFIVHYPDQVMNYMKAHPKDATKDKVTIYTHLSLDQE